MFRRFAVGIALALMLAPTPVALASTAVDQIWTSLGMWRPKDVSLGDGGVVLVVLTYAEVPEPVYVAAINSGICKYVVTRNWTLEGVTEIAVVNLSADQGYVFEGGADACKEVQGAGDGFAQSNAVLEITRPF